MNANLYAAFQRKFSQYADKPVLIASTGEQWCYKNLEEESARIANCLAEIGVEPGDRVSVQVNKSPQAMFLYLACLRAGLVFHPLNTGYRENELDYFIGNAEPSVIVCDSESEAVFSSLGARYEINNILTLDADGSGSLTQRSADCSAEAAVVERESDDLAALLYSSGTTGVPKGIMLTHHNLQSNALSLIEYWGFTDTDILLHALPIFHVHGLFVAINCVLLSGAGMRWLPSFDANQAVEYLPECTVMMGVPTYYTRLLSTPAFTQEVAANTRVFISGSAPLLEETFVEFEERTGKCILERYGMSETNMNTSNPLDGERRAGTVGFPLPGVEVRIVDENNSVLGCDEVGNLQVRGENVFKGYWKMPEKTAEDFTSDGFFNTGDKGKISDDGYVSIVGRAKDMVITGGLNVYPKEIELLIDELDGVKESAVIGVPLADFGEGVVAVVVPAAESTPEEAAIISTLKQELASFKVPKRVVVLEELPRNTMGKVQKNMLREQFNDLLS